MTQNLNPSHVNPLQLLNAISPKKGVHNKGLHMEALVNGNYILR